MYIQHAFAFKHVAIKKNASITLNIKHVLWAQLINKINFQGYFQGHLTKSFQE